MRLSLLKDMAVYGGADLAFKVLAFAVFPIYAAAFSVELFGVMTLVITVAGLVYLFLNLGQNNALARFYWDPELPPERRPALVSTGWWVLVGWSVGLTAVVLIALLPLRELLAQRYGLGWDLLVLALVANVPLLLVEYAQGVLRLRLAPAHFVAVSAVRTVASVGLGLALLYLGYGLAGVFWGNLAGYTLALPAALWLVRQELGWSFDRALARELVAFGYPFIFAGLAYWLSSSLDRWLLSELSDPTQVGLVGIAFRIVMPLAFLNAAFGQAWSPYVVKLMAEDADYRGTIGKMMTTWTFALGWAGAAVALFADEVLRLTTPSAYWAAAAPISVLAMGLVLLGTTQITAVGISLEKKSTLLSRAAWITAVVNLGLNLALIPGWGALGAGVATLVSYGVMTGLYLFWTQRLHPLDLEGGKLALTGLFLAAALWLSLLLPRYGTSLPLMLLKLAFLGSMLLVGWSTGLVRLPSSPERPVGGEA